MHKIVIPNIYEYIEKIVNQIPPGRVSTFKLIAEALGSKYATRFVSQVIKNLDVPWWRVVNERGEIKNFEQIIRLKRESINISGCKIDLNKYLFRDFSIDKKPLEILRNVQKDLSKRIVLKDDFSEINTIGGVDLSYKKDQAIVVYVILDNKLNLLEKYIFTEKVEFPYIPTFLSFREGEPIIKTFSRIHKPDILFVNGQGIAHPVRLGLASYVGVLLNIPTVGITKKHLYGIIKDNKIFDSYNNLIGFILEKNGKRVYVSPGHRISVNTAKELSENFWIKGNYPEPIRLADEISKKAK